MDWNERLEQLLTLFRENISGADFTRAYSVGQGSRAPVRPVVTGEVEQEVFKAESEEVRYRFRIYLPESSGGEEAQELFAAMCSLAGSHFPGFSAISRGAADRDRTTGLLVVSCTLSFLFREDGSGSVEGGGRRAVLGGKEYTVSGIKTTISRSGKELTAIGETVPFALLDEVTEYTVELEGLDVTGLENITGFTAALGNGPDAVYLGCRWKSLSDVQGKAVFVSRQKQSGEEA